MATRSKMSNKASQKRVLVQGAEQERKHTVDEGVQDGHGTGRDTSVRVDLLQDWRKQSVQRVLKT